VTTDFLAVLGFLVTVIFAFTAFLFMPLPVGGDGNTSDEEDPSDPPSNTASPSLSDADTDSYALQNTKVNCAQIYQIITLSWNKCAHNTKLIHKFTQTC
jgi:hypothetical protein